MRGDRTAASRLPFPLLDVVALRGVALREPTFFGSALFSSRFVSCRTRSKSDMYSASWRSAAVCPVMAQCSLFCTVAKNSRNRRMGIVVDG